MKNLNKLNSDNSDGNKDANKPEQIIDWDKIKDFQTTDYLLEHEDFSNARIEKAYPQLEGESESDYKDRIEGIKQLFEKQKSIVDSEGKRTDYYMSSEQGKSELHAEEKLDEIIGKIDEKVQSGVLSKESGEKIKNKVLDNAVEKIENIRGEYRDQQLDRETKAYIAWLAQNAPEDTRETIDTNTPAKDDASVFQIPKGDQDNPEPESSANDDGRLDGQNDEASVTNEQEASTDPNANEAFASNDSEPLPENGQEKNANDEIIIPPEGFRNVKEAAKRLKESPDVEPSSNVEAVVSEDGKNMVKNAAKNIDTAQKPKEQPTGRSIFDRWNNRMIMSKAERDKKTDRRIRALGKIAPFLVPESIRNEVSETGKEDKAQGSPNRSGINVGNTVARQSNESYNATPTEKKTLFSKDEVDTGEEDTDEVEKQAENTNVSSPESSDSNKPKSKEEIEAIMNNLSYSEIVDLLYSRPSDETREIIKLLLNRLNQS